VRAVIRSGLCRKRIIIVLGNRNIVVKLDSLGLGGPGVLALVVQVAHRGGLQVRWVLFDEGSGQTRERGNVSFLKCCHKCGDDRGEKGSVVERYNVCGGTGTGRGHQGGRVCLEVRYGVECMEFEGPQALGGDVGCEWLGVGALDVAGAAFEVHATACLGEWGDTYEVCA
jgi:hypothetical protein